MAAERDILDAVQRRIFSAREAGSVGAARFWISVLRYLIASNVASRRSDQREQIVEAAGSASARPALGDLLHIHAATPEESWLELMQAIVSGEVRALETLYARTSPIVFTLVTRITRTHRGVAEDLTLDVFHDVWRRALMYHPGHGTVVAWVMNRARSRAFDFHDGQVTRYLARPMMQPATDVLLSPPAILRERLISTISSGRSPAQLPPADAAWVEPVWVEATGGVSYKLLAVDTERDRVSMLVSLVPGGDYPPHRHAGVEEVHLLHGELIVDEKRLHPGDYLRSRPGSIDHRVWSATGCTCVLITSTRDALLS